MLNRNIFQKVMKENVLNSLQRKCQDMCLPAGVHGLWLRVAAGHVSHRQRERPGLHLLRARPPRSPGHCPLGRTSGWRSQNRNSFQDFQVLITDSKI